MPNRLVEREAGSSGSCPSVRARAGGDPGTRTGRVGLRTAKVGVTELRASAPYRPAQREPDVFGRPALPMRTRLVALAPIEGDDVTHLGRVVAYGRNPNLSGETRRLGARFRDPVAHVAGSYVKDPRCWMVARDRPRAQGLADRARAPVSSGAAVGVA